MLNEDLMRGKLEVVLNYTGACLVVLCLLVLLQQWMLQRWLAQGEKK